MEIDDVVFEKNEDDFDDPLDWLHYMRSTIAKAFNYDLEAIMAAYSRMPMPELSPQA